MEKRNQIISGKKLDEWHMQTRKAEKLHEKIPIDWDKERKFSFQQPYDRNV